MQLPSKPRSVATLQFGAEPPKPHPPSPLVWATTGPAHLPVLKEQQPCWQSESEVQDSKTVSFEDWSPEEDEEDESLSLSLDALCLCFLPESPPLESLFAPSGKGMLSNWEVNLAAAITPGLDSAARAPATHTPRLRTVATSQLGFDSPNPHPPSPLVWAIPGPAHLPVLKEQQPCWQSESWVQSLKTVTSPRR